MIEVYDIDTPAREARRELLFAWYSSLYLYKKKILLLLYFRLRRYFLPRDMAPLCHITLSLTPLSRRAAALPSFLYTYALPRCHAELWCLPFAAAAREMAAFIYFLSFWAPHLFFFPLAFFIYMSILSDTELKIWYARTFFFIWYYYWYYASPLPSSIDDGLRFRRFSFFLYSPLFFMRFRDKMALRALRLPLKICRRLWYMIRERGALAPFFTSALFTLCHIIIFKEKERGACATPFLSYYIYASPCSHFIIMILLLCAAATPCRRPPHAAAAALCL